MNRFKTQFINSIITICLSAIALAGCKKEASCFGPDCTFPEATVAIDSIVNDHIYVTLINSEGFPFAYPLTLSPEVNEEEFMTYSGFNGSSVSGIKSGNRTLKVYYVSQDQSYVLNNATYINAFETSLEIVAFGQDLKLTY